MNIESVEKENFDRLKINKSKLKRFVPTTKSVYNPVKLEKQFIHKFPVIFKRKV